MTDITLTSDTPADITLYHTEGGAHWLAIGTDVIQLPATYDPSERVADDVEAIVAGDWSVADADVELDVIGYYDWRDEYLEIADVVYTYDVDAGRQIAQHTEPGLEVTVYEHDEAELLVEYLTEGNEDKLIICTEPTDALDILPVTCYAIYSASSGVLQGLISLGEADSEEAAAQQLLEDVGGPEGQYIFDVYLVGPLFAQLHEYDASISPTTRATRVTATL